LHESADPEDRRRSPRPRAADHAVFPERARARTAPRHGPARAVRADRVLMARAARRWRNAARSARGERTARVASPSRRAIQGRPALPRAVASMLGSEFLTLGAHSSVG